MFGPIVRHCVAAFCLDLSVILIQTAAPFYVIRHLHGGVSESSSTGAAMSIAYAGVCIAGSFMIGHVRKGVALAALGAAMSSACMAFVGNAGSVLAFGALVTGALGSVGLSWPSMHAWLGAEPDTRRRATLMARYNMSWSAGMAVAALIAGPLFETNPGLPFTVAAVCAGVAALLLFLQPHERDFFGAASPPLPLELDTAGPLGEAFLYPTWLACFTGWSLLGACRYMFPKRVDEVAESGALVMFPWSAESVSFGAPTAFSILAFGLTATSIAVFYVMGRRQGWIHRMGVLLGMQCVAAAALWVLGTTESFAVMFLCFSFIGINSYAIFFASLFYSMANLRLKGRRASINEGIVGGGGFVGSLVFGRVAAEYTLATPFLYAPFVVVASVAAQALLLRWLLGRIRPEGPAATRRSLVPGGAPEK